MNISFSLIGGDQLWANVFKTARVAVAHKFGGAGVFDVGAQLRSRHKVRGLMATHLQQQVELLQAACRRLVLQPDEEPARQGVLRAITIVPLMAEPGASTSVGGLLGEAKSNAERLAYRLEGAGCDRVVVCALAAALGQTLATPPRPAGNLELCPNGGRRGSRRPGGQRDAQALYSG